MASIKMSIEMSNAEIDALLDAAHQVQADINAGLTDQNPFAVGRFTCCGPTTGGWLEANRLIVVGEALDGQMLIALPDAMRSE